MPEKQRSKAFQLQALIEQSFEIFNLYGKPSESVKSVIKGFNLTMEPYDIYDINAAFKQWMAEKSVMPTPADIVEIIKGIMKHRREMAVKPEPRAQPVHRNPGPASDAVPWYGLRWPQFTQAHLAALQAHLATMEPEAAREYRLYLHHHAGAPHPNRDGEQ